MSHELLQCYVTGQYKESHVVFVVQVEATENLAAINGDNFEEFLNSHSYKVIKVGTERAANFVASELKQGTLHVDPKSIKEDSEYVNVLSSIQYSDEDGSVLKDCVLEFPSTVIGTINQRHLARRKEIPQKRQHNLSNVTNPTNAPTSLDPEQVVEKARELAGKLGIDSSIFDANLEVDSKIFNSMIPSFTKENEYIDRVVRDWYEHNCKSAGIDIDAASNPSVVVYPSEYAEKWREEINKTHSAVSVPAQVIEKSSEDNKVPVIVQDLFKPHSIGTTIFNPLKGIKLK